MNLLCRQLLEHPETGGVWGDSKQTTVVCGPWAVNSEGWGRPGGRDVIWGAAGMSLTRASELCCGVSQASPHSPEPSKCPQIFNPISATDSPPDSSP